MRSKGLAMAEAEHRSGPWRQTARRAGLCICGNSSCPSCLPLGCCNASASRFGAQDPAYPVYVDSSVIMGMTGGHNGTGFDNIQYMVCRPENNFFPDLSKVGAVGCGCVEGGLASQKDARAGVCEGRDALRV